MKKIIRLISSLLVLLGIIGFLASTLLFKDQEEFPLGAIVGFVVDSDQNIYIGSGFYQLVQVYNKDGVFLRNWFIKAKGGTFSIHKTEKDELLIKIGRGDEEFLFDKKGTLIAKNEVRSNSNTKIDSESYTTKEGVRYELRGTLLQEIVRVDQEEAIIVNQSLFLQVLKGPLNVWLLIIFGAFIGSLTRGKKDLTHKGVNEFKERIKRL